MSEKKSTVYLPKIRTRIGKTGYKGKNVKTYDPRDGSPVANTTAIASTPKKAATPAKTGPKKGLKPLKARGSSK